MGVGPKGQGNVLEWVQSAKRMQGNAEECQGSLREWVQCTSEMQENNRGTYWSGCKVPCECRGMQENARGM